MDHPIFDWIDANFFKACLLSCLGAAAVLLPIFALLAYGRDLLN